MSNPITIAPLACYICHSQTNVRLRDYRPPSVLLCQPCHKLSSRKFNKHRGRQRDRIVEVPTRVEWIETLRSAWDLAGACFRCMLSGVPLALGNPASARYPTLEHTSPSTGERGWLVVAAVINDMKSDFAVDEFKAAIPLLAKVLTHDGNADASSRLCDLLDSLKHFRRIKKSSVPTEIVVSEAE